MTTSTERQQFRATLATLAAKTQTKIPTLNGRVEKALRLALAGDVETYDDGTATVYSSSDPTRRYELREGTCTCRDWEQAPAHLCQHRLAAGFVRKAAKMLPAAPDVETEPTSPLPEAPVSLTLKGLIHGQEVMVTLRGVDFASVQAQVEAASQWLDAKPTPEPTPQCWEHDGVPMKLQHGKDGSTWYSHKTVDGGWCKGTGARRG